jgi:hypothetical protein
MINSWGKNRVRMNYWRGEIRAATKTNKDEQRVAETGVYELGI